MHAHTNTYTHMLFPGSCSWRQVVGLNLKGDSDSACVCVCVRICMCQVMKRSLLDFLIWGIICSTPRVCCLLSKRNFTAVSELFIYRFYTFVWVTHWGFFSLNIWLWSIVTLHIFTLLFAAPFALCKQICLCAYIFSNRCLYSAKTHLMSACHMSAWGLYHEASSS